MTNWKIGMKVVCVRTGYESYGLIKDKTYALTDVMRCSCGRTTVSYGVPCSSDKYEVVCLCSKRLGVGLNEWYANKDFFRPLQYDSNAATEILVKFQPLEERSDAPVTKPEKQTV